MTTQPQLFTCRVCRCAYDESLDQCPRCKAWQGDNKVLVDRGSVREHPAPQRARDPLAMFSWAGGLVFFAGCIMIAVGMIWPGVALIGVSVLCFVFV